MTGAPAEAVDPRTPALGSKGRKTERFEGMLVEWLGGGRLLGRAR